MMLAEIVRLGEAGVALDELDTMRAGLKSSLIMSQESSMSRSGSLASDWYFLGRVRPIEEIARLDALTPEAVSNTPRGSRIPATRQFSRSVQPRSSSALSPDLRPQSPADHARFRPVVTVPTSHHGLTPMRFQQTTLGNGMQVIAELNDQAYSVAAGFLVKTGSRDESAELAGVSHFLEHMTFKGTPRRDAVAVNRDFDRVGAKHNAQTSEEDTFYHVTCLPEYLPQAFDVLSDILRPTLRGDDFETEKKVIIEEIRMYLDNPMSVAYEAAKAAHFGKHPLGNSILGTVESIAGLQADQMRVFHPSVLPVRISYSRFAGKTDWNFLVDLAQGTLSAPGKMVLHLAKSGPWCAARVHFGRFFVLKISSKPSWPFTNDAEHGERRPLRGPPACDDLGRSYRVTALLDLDRSRFSQRRRAFLSGPTIMRRAFFSFLSCGRRATQAQPRSNRRAFTAQQWPKA